MSDQNCSQCVDQRVEPRCYLRLFGLFDDGYTPRPHQGHEYGDYSRRVTIDGTPQRQLTVAMKSYRGKNKVTARSRLGQDIYSQVMGYLHDGTIDIVGICLPGKLEERFASQLVHDARLNQKKLIFINDDDLVKITYSAMLRNNMRLNQI